MTEGNFLIEDWLVEVQLGRVSLGDQQKHLEPQVMKVLSYLASNAGEVVTKQQLLDTLWNGSIVNDPALTRCISQIRQALGDDPKKPRYIQTIPKIGYRLVATIRSPGRGATLMGRVRWAVAATVIAAVALALFARSGQPPQSVDSSIEIQAIVNSSDDANADVIAYLLDSEIAGNLARVNGLTILEPQSEPVGEISDDVTDYVLGGRIEERDGGTVYAAQLFDNRSQDRLWRRDYPLVDADLFAVRQDVIGQVARALDTDIPGSLQARLEQRPTSDFLAYNAYVRGREYYFEYEYIPNESAITMFEHAIARDPDFGLAYAGLSDSLAQQAIFWSGNRLSEARRAAEKAIELAPGCDEPYKALGLALQANGDSDGAFAAYQQALELDPDAWEAAFNMATILVAQSQLQDAEKLFLTTLRVAPDHHIAMARLGAIYLKLGDMEKAELWLDRALEHSPLRPNTIASYAALDMLNGKTRAAIARCERVFVVFNNNYRCLRLIATARLIEGDLAESQRMFDLMVLKWPDDGYALLGRAQVLLADGKVLPALDLVNRVIAETSHEVTSGSDDWFDYWVLAAAYALKGDADDAFQSLEEAAQAGHRFYLWDSVEPAFAGLHSDQRFDAYLAMMRTGPPDRPSAPTATGSAVAVLE
jgi:DNA-binding winged helix-turn-helix (wHTH) protein/tetratricopeptide (TPR) repeat protein